MIQNNNVVTGADRKRSDYVPGVMVVRWKDDVLHDMPISTRSTRAMKVNLPSTIVDPLNMLRDRFGLRRVVELNSDLPQTPVRTTRRSMSMSADAVVRSLNPSTSALRGLTVLELDSKNDRDVERAVKLLKSDPSVSYAEPAARRWLATVPNDPEYNVQWGLPMIKWTGTVRPDASGINVGIIDSGVDRNHPDLQRSIRSYDHSGSSAKDLIGHGTHVAGIIAAGINNNVGIAGIANCRLHCWKIFPDGSSADSIDNVAYYRALNAVLNSRGANEVKILNLSIGGIAFDRTEELLIQRLIRKGVIVVAAMGNEYQEGNPTEYPASIKGVVAVGAIKQNLSRAPFSNTGKHISIMAPGVAILSTLPTTKSSIREEVMYESLDGTSMATPIVAAAAALVWARNPSFTSDQVRAKLTDYTNTTHPPGMNGKRWTKVYGSGVVNLKLALR